MRKRRLLSCGVGLTLGLMAVGPWAAPASAQDMTEGTVSYLHPKEYQIADITVSGVNFLDNGALIHLSGLKVGQRVTIPGDVISDAVDKLWRQGLFENIQITATQIEGNRIYLDLYMEERPRVTGIVYEGSTTAITNKIKEEISIKDGDVVTDYKIAQLEKKVMKVLVDKAYLNAKVQVVKRVDTASSNALILIVKIDKGEKVKIEHIDFEGNTAKRVEDASSTFWKKFAKKVSNAGNKEDLAFTDNRLRRKLKNTKQISPLRFWKRSKYVPSEFQDDLKELVKVYNREGFRDFRVVDDSLYTIDPKRIGLKIKLYEGDPYYYGNINFVGNKKYTNEQLQAVLNIKKGDLYNEEKFNQNLMMNPNGVDVYAMYFDDGYLYFRATPVETQVYEDTVDIEIRIVEGNQARFNEIRLKGNTRTNDNVILRETRTVPGQLFSRTELVNSINALRQLRYFNDETLNAEPLPRADGSADLEYQVEEVGSDQLELSGGWGGGMIVGTIGVVFNNFSIKNIFKKDRWKPLPTGDGQQLSLRAQSNGTYYWSVSASFTEPWLGGKKPLAFSVSYNHSMQSNNLSKQDARYGRLDIDGVSVGLGQRLKWPDDFFTLYQAITYQRYAMQNYEVNEILDNGVSHNVNYSITLSRQNLDASFFPKTGSTLSLTAQLTPPYSALGSTLYQSENPEDKYKLLEYYKISFKAGWYFNPIANLVVNARFRLGYMGYYNKNVGYPPFERFFLGGDGLTGFALDGRELIGMRGYSNNSLSPTSGATAYNKLTLEVRYPLSNNPVATIYALAFFEAGNSWAISNQMDPFHLYKSAGVGLRLYLSAMGMFGIDWGYGFDPVPGDPKANGSHFHFSINQSLDW
ncbi:MAG: BamA/TamA family outer membrane protein [Bacteroidales bacterium]|nr:BamA/TamA family outer membrane protein [Bacteroidales bacterium]